MFVKFLVTTPLDDSEVPTYLLAWTTTPWTLPGNTALAVDQAADYSVVELAQDGATERLVLATQLLQATFDCDYTVVDTTKGADLVGLKYQQLYARRNMGLRYAGSCGGNPPLA